MYRDVDLVQTKADESSGSFEALASVFGNIDSQSEVVMPGAFSASLKAWRRSGQEIPVIVSHNASDPFAYIGSCDPNDVRETEEGLHVKGTLDTSDNPTAAQVARLMKRGNLSSWSFGFVVPKGGSRKRRDGVKELNQVELLEVGPTLRGANSLARTLAVKSLDDTPEQFLISDPGDLERRLREKGIIGRKDATAPVPIQVATFEV